MGHPTLSENRSFPITGEVRPPARNAEARVRSNQKERRMRNSGFIRTAMMVAGLAVGYAEHVSGATELRADQDEGGRQVTLKPISESRLGGDGGNEWLLSGALAGIGLLFLGGLVTGKIIDK